MTKGIGKKNTGPCVVCGQNDPKIEYRKLTANSIIATFNSPVIQNINIKLQVNDQLCKKHYNDLVTYGRGKGNSQLSVKQKDNDRSFHYTGKNRKRVCLTQEVYQELYNKAMSVEQLEKKINELETDLDKYMAEPKELHEKGNNSF
jgi:hypothetical protein